MSYSGINVLKCSVQRIDTEMVRSTTNDTNINSFSPAVAVGSNFLLSAANEEQEGEPGSTS